MKRTKNLIFLTILIWGIGIYSSCYSQSANQRKSLFLTETERAKLINLPSNSPTASLLSAMQSRVEKRALSPSFSDATVTNEWWHHASEYLTDAALIHAIRPSANVDTWLRSSVLSIIRRPVADWAGPRFRGYGGGDMTGGLETAHLTWGIGIAFDLAADLFTPTEQEEIKNILKEKGLIPCKRYLDNTDHFHNWNCVLFAGYSVAAAVLADNEALVNAQQWLAVCKDHFQDDGSYGESLQYANYAAYSIMIGYEALIRAQPSMPVSLEPYGRMTQWSSQALFYRKPLSGWPLMDWPRSANFGDAAAIFRPSGDLLVHIAARAQNEMPQEAELARWLFDELYFPANEPGPHDLASFGFVNDFGFLSVIMLADAAPAISPDEAKLPLVTAYSGGDAFARDEWGGKTILAARIPAEPRHAVSHLHGDVNSFILVHNKERLLVDPGHSCYRNITHALETESSTHNTCTFEVDASDTNGSYTLNQQGAAWRKLYFDNEKPKGEAPLEMGGARLITTQLEKVSVIGADAAQMYGAPLKKFERFFVMCGSNALFVVDHIQSDLPVKTTWNWLLNNRDGLLDYQMNKPASVLTQRGDAGLKIFHYGNGYLNGPTYALVHDAYHPLPAQRGEGKPGSGMLMRWKESKSQKEQIVLHALAVDTHAGIKGWNSHSEANLYFLENTDRQQKWTLRIENENTFYIHDQVEGKTYKLYSGGEKQWKLIAE